MVLENYVANVKIEVDETYTIDSVDNRYYDITLNPFGYKRGDHVKTLAVSVDLFTKNYSIALIGCYSLRESECAILEDNLLTVLMDYQVVQIDLTSGAVVCDKALNTMGFNYAIYKVDRGYLLHGDVQITMLDTNFQEKWTFAGEDIFSSVTGKNSFEMKKDRICLYDFCDNYYELDYDGNRIK